jgi:hypothetical protein
LAPSPGVYGDCYEESEGFDNERAETGWNVPDIAPYTKYLRSWDDLPIELDANWEFFLETSSTPYAVGNDLTGPFADDVNHEYGFEISAVWDQNNHVSPWCDDNGTTNTKSVVIARCDQGVTNGSVWYLTLYRPCINNY